MNAAGVTVSVRVFDLRHSDGGSEKASCLGVDVHALTGAPGEELLRIEYGADDDEATAFPVALLALGVLGPGLVDGREDVRILHDFEEARIVLASDPSDSDRARFDLSHNTSPLLLSGDSTIERVGEGR